jgi:hypothetical protein
MCFAQMPSSSTELHFGNHRRGVRRAKVTRGGGRNLLTPLSSQLDLLSTIYNARRKFCSQVEYHT